ncbi:conserved hypothetical protein [Streptomyces sviceus ATCC 29083]|uniref:Uncharacterized protein n=1 Tax=Streptomyces sviceus (strain ATCC 29083 / DSM 924 / JCM 4929 / NBRC 13980 / NCIMB 11184 / NRRL 5439 / UC 5370) TaxID=463191 RepID=B5I5Z4_STRX2|nr:conserved hypothetical protein [Streptomyces sviceus ATCC 29083]
MTEPGVQPDSSAIGALNWDFFPVRVLSRIEALPLLSRGSRAFPCKCVRVVHWGDLSVVGVMAEGTGTEQGPPEAASTSTRGPGRCVLS